MMNKKNNKQFLNDLLGFVRYIHNDPTMSIESKYSAIVSTIGQDRKSVV